MANNNKALSAAGQAKKDEFYTQLVDIENELRHYKEHFKGKVVFCNCDDPYESNFFKYFAINFNHLGLKKLICTCYAGSPVVYTQLSLFGDEEVIGEEPSDKKPYKIEITHVDDLNGDGAVDLTDVELLLRSVDGKPTLLEGDGDFRSAECIELLKEADIVVTNPPFSLFREYVAQLMEYNKLFIIIGRMSAIHYKEIFPLIQHDNLWIGYGFNLSLVYKTPYENTEEANRKFVSSKGYNPKDGFVKVPAICWYTNIDCKKRHEDLVLFKSYSTEYYPTYENFNAIEVGNISDIPCDYYGMMGVPDTFLDKYNPEQFEIIGLAESGLGVSIGISAGLSKEQLQALKAENPSFRRGNPIYRDSKGILKKPFSRIIIRRKM